MDESEGGLKHEGVGLHARLVVESTEHNNLATPI